MVVTAAALLLGSLFVGSTTLYLTRSSSVSSVTGIHCWTVKLRAKLLLPGGRSTRIHRRTGLSLRLPWLLFGWLLEECCAW